MTDDHADEQELPPELEDDQPAGEDDAEPEVSANPRDTGAYRIDQILAQNLRGALAESRRRTGEVEEVDEVGLEPEPTEPDRGEIAWKETTDTFAAVRDAAEVPAVDLVGEETSDAEEAAIVGSTPEDEPPLLHYDEVVRSNQRMNAVSDGISSFLGKPRPSEEEPSVWKRLRRWLMPTQEERMVEAEERLLALNEAIEDAPDAAVNYLARGELLLEIGRVGEAIDDFERVETLAAKDFEDRRWGVVAQALRDRARRGREQAQKRR
jgi:tetratricopeptide (TPR) repeat protein